MVSKCFLQRFLGVLVMADIGGHKSRFPTEEEPARRQKTPKEESPPLPPPPPSADMHHGLSGQSHVRPSPPASNSFILYELRRDQTRKMLGSVSNKDTWVIGPGWVRDVLLTLDQQTNHIEEVHVTGEAGGNLLQGALSFVFKDKHEGSSSSQTEKYSHVSLPKQLNLFKLQVLARNEHLNVDGRINQALYAPGLTDLSLIITLKDLVRQTVIVAEAWTTKYGGYRTAQHSQSARVFVCDLAALQFQDPTNSGRLVLIPHGHSLPQGLLDEHIFNEVVHERKKSHSEAAKQAGPGQRFVPVHSRIFGPVFFDTVAYKRFVAADFVLAGLAVEHLAAKKGSNVQFKFLKYGTGFFSGEFTGVIEAHILEGVLDGIERLFMQHGPKHIKSIALPFFRPDGVAAESRVAALSARFSVQISFNNDDALKVTEPGLVLALTNCGDPHAVFGNEMGYSSVDAAIAENLKDKGAALCPLLLQGAVSEVVITSKI